MHSVSKTGCNVTPENSSLRPLSPLQLPLAKRFYQQAAYRCRFNRNSRVFALYLHHDIIAAVQLDNEGDYDFLRAMVVAPALRGRGYAHYLLQQLQPHLENCTCWCFPFQYLENLYRAAGFIATDTGRAPVALQQRLARYQRQGKALITMRRELRQ